MRKVMDYIVEYTENHKELAPKNTSKVLLEPSGSEKSWDFISHLNTTNF